MRAECATGGPNRLGPRAGSTFIELLFAISVVSISLTLLVHQVAVSTRAVSEDAAVQFAHGKAVALLAELQSSIDQRRITTLAELDAAAAPEPSPYLTTHPVAAPDDILSGNSRTSQGTWRWSRTIELEPIEGLDRIRYAKIQVLRVNDLGVALHVAGTAGLISVPVTPEPMVTEFDVYVLAIAEAPSLWLPLPALRAQLQSTATAVESANPHLRFRLHWITKLGYGRNLLYTPYVNQSATADAAAPWVYWYPGRLAAGAGASTLYSAELFSGRLRTESGVLNDYDATDNPQPHAVADRFNHCMRTPDAQELFARRVAAGLENEDEPPLQLLLADMCSNPQRYRNALFINLHGSGLPFPPLRNVSDAAKHEDWPTVRVVSHARRLHTMRQAGGEPVEFRVHAYKTDPDAGPTVLSEPISVEIPGGDYTGSVVVDCQSGGIDIKTGNVAAEPYAVHTARRGGAGASANEMYYTVHYAAAPFPHTYLLLYNTPLSCPPVAGQGIDPAARLYGTDYIPSPVTAGAFKPLSAVDASPQPKNTMRWRIRLPQAALQAESPNQVLYSATTFIGTGHYPRRVWPTQQTPENESTTHAWISTDPADVPITERYQLIGDPRFNPYLDVGGDGTTFAHGYNWWFDDLVAKTGDARAPWSAFDTARLADGFAGMNEDVPRMLQIWREALQSTQAVFANPGGVLAERLLLGGEIALPDNAGGAAPVVVHGDLYGAAGTVGVDDISMVAELTEGRRIGRPVLVGNGTTFWAKPWLGELAPPAQMNAFHADCNLPTSTVRRAVRANASLAALPAGTLFAYPSGSTLGEAGPASLVQVGPPESTLRLGLPPVAEEEALMAPMTTEGAELEVRPRYYATLTDELTQLIQRMGLLTPSYVTAELPIQLPSGITAVLPQRAHAADYPDHRGQLLESFSAGNLAGHGAALIALDHPVSTGRTAYFVPFGETPRTTTEHQAASLRSLAYSLRALHVAGAPRLMATPALHLPRVQLVDPTPQQSVSDPGAIPLLWSTSFTRFDGERYTASYPDPTNSQESQLVYTVCYRTDASSQWYYAVDRSPATPGEQPTAILRRLADAGPGDESYLMPTPTDDFPAGNYVVRVDCYHGTSGVHVSHHEVKLSIQRPTAPD